MKEDKTIYEQIALENGVSAQEVRADIMEAIAIAEANQQQSVKEKRKEILGSEDMPSPEELIRLVAEYILKLPPEELVS